MDNFDKLESLIRQVEYGKIEIKIQNGKPVMAEKTKKKIKLGKDSDFFNSTQTS